MALKSCRECNKKVSTEAAACPSCGAPDPTSKKLTKSLKSSKEVVMYTFFSGPAKISTTYKSDLTFCFWGLYIGGNVVGNILLLFIKKGLFLKIIFGGIILWNLAAILFVIEVANEYKASSIEKGEDYLWANVAKITVIVLTLSAIGNAL